MYTAWNARGDWRLEQEGYGVGAPVKVFQTRLETSVYDRVKSLATFRGQSVNGMIRDLLAKALPAEDGKGPAPATLEKQPSL
jgi:hypothetical protein